MAKRFTLRTVIEGLKATLTPTAVTHSYSSCSFYCSHPSACPLCRAMVPAYTPHHCKRKDKRR